MRILILNQESCPHDIIGKFVLSSKAVTFVPSELTKAFRDGDELTIHGLGNAEFNLARAVVGIAEKLQTIETPNGDSIKRHPDFKVTFVAA